jgi:hypothetical protein
MMYNIKYSKPLEVNFDTGLTLKEYEKAAKAYTKQGYICEKEIQTEIKGR